MTDFPHIVYTSATWRKTDSADTNCSIDKIVEEIVKECRQDRNRSPSTERKLVIDENRSSSTEPEMSWKDLGGSPSSVAQSSLSVSPDDRSLPENNPVRPQPLSPSEAFGIPHQSTLRSILVGEAMPNNKFQEQQFRATEDLLQTGLYPFYGMDAFGRPVICFPTTSLYSPTSPNMPTPPYFFPPNNNSYQQSDESRKRHATQDEARGPEAKKRRKFSLMNAEIPMEHVDLLFEIIQTRKMEFHADPSGSNLKRLTECRLCGNCSFSSDPSTHWEFMKKHIYAHLPNGQSAFSCGLCGRSHVTCMSKVRSHIRKFHGDKLLNVHAAIQDHRKGMDEFLTELVKQCFGGARLEERKSSEEEIIDVI